MMARKVSATVISTIMFAELSSCFRCAFAALLSASALLASSYVSSARGGHLFGCVIPLGTFLPLTVPRTASTSVREPLLEDSLDRKRPSLSHMMPITLPAHRSGIHANSLVSSIWLLSFFLLPIASLRPLRTRKSRARQNVSGVKIIAHSKVIIEVSITTIVPIAAEMDHTRTNMPPGPPLMLTWPQATCTPDRHLRLIAS